MDGWSLREAALDAGSSFFASLASTYAVGVNDPRPAVVTAGIMAGLSFFRHNRRMNGGPRSSTSPSQQPTIPEQAPP